MPEIRTIHKEEIPKIKELIHLTVSSCYPSIFPPEVVKFFLEYHSEDEIKRRLDNGVVILLEEEGKLKGTGFLHGEEMGGIYVHPGYQRKGLGEMMVRYLMQLAREKQLPRIWLDATPLAQPLYDKLGFDLVSPMMDMVGDVPLHYFKMEMLLHKEHEGETKLHKEK